MAKRPASFKPSWAGKSAAEKTRTEARRIERRGTAAERGYDSKWRTASEGYRAKYPWCAYCWLQGRGRVPNDLTDHLYPHGMRRGHITEPQKALFWDKRYWVTSCHECHRGFKAQIERQGVTAVDALAERLGLEPLLDDAQRMACAEALASDARRWLYRPQDLPLHAASCDLAIFFGPPASGKSTAAQDWADTPAQVIDLDWIQAELCGRPIHECGNEKRAEAMQERNRRLMRLGEQTGRWAFVVGAPERAERDEWIEKLRPKRAILLLPDRQTLLKRVERDQSREGVPLLQGHILQRWLARYEPGGRAEVRREWVRGEGRNFPV